MLFHQRDSHLLVSPIITGIHTKLNNKHENLNGICENMENLTKKNKPTHFQRILLVKSMITHCLILKTNQQTMNHLNDMGNILYIEEEEYLSLSKITK